MVAGGSFNIQLQWILAYSWWRHVRLKNFLFLVHFLLIFTIHFWNLVLRLLPGFLGSFPALFVPALLYK